MKEKEIKELGYGVAIHFNSFKQIFEVYQIGTYHPGSPSINKDTEIVGKHKKLKKAIRLFKNNLK